MNEGQSREVITHEEGYPAVPYQNALVALMMLPFIPLLIAARVTQALLSYLQPPQAPKMHITEITRDPKTGKIVDITERWI